MAGSDKRIYRSNNPLKIILTVFIIIVLIAIVLAITVFFGFQKYIHYTDEGVSLEVPWLEETVSDTAEA